MYPAYKLIRSINRQYPNNGFINAVSVDEETYRYDDQGDPLPEERRDIIDEDVRDIINECLFEIYKDVAIEEVFSFPTVPGQNQYALPDDCDLRDVVEVTRTGGWGDFMPVGYVKPIEEIVEGELPPPDPPPEHGPYPGWVPNFYWRRRYTRRLVWARDAEELTGDRYFNAWSNKRIGICPTPANNREIITIYYKKTPKTIMYMDDDIQIKDKYMPILKYRVLMEFAKSGSHPDIDLYNTFALDFNNLLMEAKRDKDADKPYYDHVKDNDRPSAYFRRRPFRRGVRR